MKVSGFTQNGSKGKVFMGWAADLWNLPKSTVGAPNLRDFRTGRGSSWKRSLLRTEPIEQLGVEKGSRLKGKCHIHVPVNTITWERLDGPWSWSDVQSDMCPSSGQCQLYSWGESTKKLPAPLERSELFCLHRYLIKPIRLPWAARRAATHLEEMCRTGLHLASHFQVAFSLSQEDASSLCWLSFWSEDFSTAADSAPADSKALQWRGDNRIFLTLFGLLAPYH